MCKFIHLPNTGGNNITCFVNLIVKNLSPNLRKEKYTQPRKIYQLRVMEMKTEAGAVGVIFGPGHL